METSTKHPRCLEPEAIKKGIRVELVENEQVLSVGIVSSNEKKRCWGDDRHTIMFRNDSRQSESEFVHFTEHDGWKVVFPGMSNERCVARSERSHTFTLRGSVSQNT